MWRRSGKLGQTRYGRIISIQTQRYLSDNIIPVTVDLVPTIFQKINHPKDVAVRYIRDFEVLRLLNDKFDDMNTISLITRLPKGNVKLFRNFSS